jgi:hypothetical protein
LPNDTGEGGATERVLARREAFNEVEQQWLLALNTPLPDDEDPIARLALA